VITAFLGARSVDLRQSAGGPDAKCGSIGLMRQEEDWYGYLNIAPDASIEQIEQAVEQLSGQATALAVTEPERSQRLRDTIQSIERDLLSGPEAKARHDAARGAAALPAQALPAQALPAQALPAQAPPAQVPPPPLPSARAVNIPPPPMAVPPPPSYPPPPPYPPPPMAPTSPASPAAGGPYAGGPYAVGPAGGGPTPDGSPAGRPRGGERIGARLARFLRTGWVCAECGNEALPSDKFCTRCGTAISPTRRDVAPSTSRVTCANCAASVGVNDVFCAQCGTRVSK
jgi:Double zinc ribbon